MNTMRSAPLSGRLYRTYQTVIAQIVPWALASYVCLRIWLDPDFISIDYRPYLQIFDFIEQLSFTELFENAAQGLPNPYILLNNFTTIEIGFAVIIKSLSLLGFLNYQIFAILSALSIFIHQYTLANISNFRASSFLTFIYTAVLFETNAIRAGLASSLILYILYIGLIKKRRYALFLIPICFLIHVQSAAWFAVAVAAFACIKVSSDNIVLRAALLLILVSSATSAELLFNIISPQKFDSYAGIVLKSSGWTPLNAFATLICLTSFWLIISWRPNPEDDRIWKYWICAFAVFFQSTIFLIYNTTFGAVGQRVWQFSFVMFLAANLMCVNHMKKSLPPGFKYIHYSVIVLLFLLCYNILFRYPLSNIFYPFTPSISYDVV